MKMELTKLIQVIAPGNQEVVVLKGYNYFVEVMSYRTLIINSCDGSALEIIDSVKDVCYPDDDYLRVLYVSGAVLQVRRNYPSFYRSRSKKYISYFDGKSINQLNKSKL